ncbi:carboxylesterase [Colletotrichum falcatum]|nr:carboxylesterase [Colletotrichum falcatum]
MLACHRNPYLANMLALLALDTFGSGATASGTGQLPTVDLGYAIHQATYNDSRGWFNFSNIHYATASRFGAPAPVTIVDRQINDGQTPGICPSKLPTWFELNALYQVGQISLEELNSTYIELLNLSPSSDAAVIDRHLIAPDPRATEDCLTLDIVVPETIWEKAHDAPGAGAPVLVWIYGGGYTVGDKNSVGNPAGLIGRPRADGSDGFVYVAINYRLGLFGFLSGPDYEEQGGVSNLGLRDQRFALGWIQDNIRLFGGNPENVTVLGESAGGGSVLHQITAYGSAGRAPFARAVLQSPGFEPNAGPVKQAQRYDNVLRWASHFSNSSVATLGDLRRASLGVMDRVNQITVATAYWSSFGWGPATDGDFVPDPPGVLLSEGRFDASVEVLGAHNSDEGFIFATPLVGDDDDQYISALLKPLLPGASDRVFEHVAAVLYPAVYDGTYPWMTPLERTSATAADAWFVCNNYALNRALSGSAFNYLFDVAPGYHGTDLPYTFFNEETGSGGPPLNASVAGALQAYLSNFVMTGSPNGAGLPRIPPYGPEASVLSLYNGTVFADTAARERCDWWSAAMYR